ncbi:MAG: hypothetical protein CMI53_03480 [Parcubacteria group bacterium]|nr:hypothetical protein [Parcubacteria group bacterium]|tara:strand:- start:3063 stop:3758 length:696 start_codon:yes stop_codon:yes gene_type:complete
MTKLLSSLTQNKKVNTVIFLLILFLAIIFFGYYFFSSDPGNQVNSNDDIDDYVEEFNVSEGDKSELEILLNALEQNQNNPDLFLKLGSLKKNAGDYLGAEEAWLKAVELRPLGSIAFGNLADLYTNFLQDSDKATSAYESVLENTQGEPKNIFYYRNYFDFALFNLEDKEKAVAVMLDGIANNPGNSELPAVLAGFYRDEGNITKAIQYFQLALDLDPNDDLVAAELEKLQ